MKPLATIFIIQVLLSGNVFAGGLTSYSDDVLCAQTEEIIASYMNDYIENFKSCFALAQKSMKNSMEYKGLVDKSNEIRLSISGELYNCGYYCDNPTPCMNTTNIMLTKPEGGKDAIACWGTAW